MRWIVAALLVSTATAQDLGGRVSGIVRDGIDGAILGATVTLVGGAAFPEQTTGADGRFRVDRVRPGRYELRVGASGFSTRKLPIVVTGAGIDVGTVVLRVPCMHCELPFDLDAPEADCWDAAKVDATAPIVSAKRLAQLATAKPLPVAKADGTARVQILVTPSGFVGCVAAIEGDPKFAAAALVTVRQWRFPPGPAFIGNLLFRQVRGRVSLQ